MAKKKTSVLFIKPGSNESKLLQVPTHFIRNWRRYLFSFAGLVVFLIGIIAWLGFNTYKNAMATPVVVAAVPPPAVVKDSINVDQLKQSVVAIDSSLERIEEYLQKRGIKGVALPNTGGVDSLVVENVTEFTDFFKTYLLGLEKKIASVPLGVPSDGNISSGFGQRSNPFGTEATEAHEGLDFRGNTGDPVTVTANGVVSFSGSKGGYGNCIIVDHSNGVQTLYGHLSRILVKPGQQLAAGNKIGLVGSTGRSTGPHLHYEVIRNGTKINPKSYLNL